MYHMKLRTNHHPFHIFFSTTQRNTLGKFVQCFVVVKTKTKICHLLILSLKYIYTCVTLMTAHANSPIMVLKARF